MHQYQVTFIGESDLPEAQDWVLVDRRGVYHAFIKRSAVTPATLSECWAAYVEMEREAPVDPRQIPALQPYATAQRSGSRA